MLKQLVVCALTVITNFFLKKLRKLSASFVTSDFCLVFLLLLNAV